MRKNNFARSATSLLLALLLPMAPAPAAAASSGEKALQFGPSKHRQTSLVEALHEPIVRRIEEGEVLRVSYAVAPSLWKSKPDQSWEFTISIKSRGKTEILHTGLLQPGRRSADRGWKNVDADLAPYAGTKSRLTFTCGPPGEKPAKNPVDGLMWGGFRIQDDRARADRPNVVLISVDGLRADHLTLYGYRRPTSPFLDAMATRGVWFQNAIAQSSWCRPSYMSMLTGLEPSSHGVWNPLEDGPGVDRSPSIPTLAEILQQDGYLTQAFTGAGDAGADNDFGRGFLRYEETNDEDHRDARFVFGEARRFVKKNAGRRFFLFVQTYDGPHKPYRRKFFVRQAEDAKKKPTDVDRYDGGVRAADGLIHELFAELQAAGVVKNTIFIVTSDHGTELEDRGYDFKGYGHSLYDDVLRVPLIIRFDGHVEPRQITRYQAQHIDIAPTVLDLAGIDASKFSFGGRSLKALLEGGEIPAGSDVISERTRYGGQDLYSLRHVGDHSYKLIYSPSVAEKRGPFKAKPEREDRYWYKRLIPAGGIEFYDLTADPAEKRNLSSSAPPPMKTMSDQLKEFIRRRDSSPSIAPVAP